VVLLHLLNIKQQSKVEVEGEEDDDAPDDEGRDEVIIDCLIKFWERALTTWLPNELRPKVCQWISNFLLQKSLLGNAKIRDFCIQKLQGFVID